MRISTGKCFRGFKRKLLFMFIFICLLLWIWIDRHSCYSIPALLGATLKRIKIWPNQVYKFNICEHFGGRNVKIEKEECGSSKQYAKKGENKNDALKSSINDTSLHEKPFFVEIQVKSNHKNISSEIKHPYIQRENISLFDNVFKVNRRYIIYLCDDRIRCGGWSDRLKGILSCFTLSRLMNYNFGIVHKRKGGDFETVFKPNTIDWIFKKKMTNTKEYHYFHFGYSADFLRNISTMNLTTTFKYHYNFIRISMDIMPYIRKRLDAEINLLWLFELHDADIYRKLYRSLFLPKSLSSDLVQFKRTLDKTRKIVCAHVRTGYNITSWKEKSGFRFFPSNKIDVFLNFLGRFNSSSYYIYVASDSDYVRSEAKRKLPNIIDIPGPITHIDMSANLEVSKGGFKKTLLEFTWLSSECETLLLTRSGFGFIAGYINYNSINLFCMKKDGVTPCTRYTVVART